MSNLLKDASILLTPTAYENGRMNAIKPSKDLYGPELVTNGDFATDSGWNKTGTWSISNGQASANANSTSQYIQQDFTITNGKTYLFTYEVIENTLNGNGSSLSNSGGFGSVAISNVIGTHQVYITATNSSATNVLMIGVSATCTTGTIKIDNVSVVEDLSGDFQFERNSAATRVNAQGLVENVQIISPELVSNGNFSQIGTEEVLNGNFSQEGSELVTNGSFTNGGTGWTLQNGWSIGNDVAVFSGTVSAYRTIYQQSILTIGKTYKLTFDIVSISSGSIENISQSNPTSYNTQGTITEYFTASNDDLFLKPTTDADCSITNVSVKEVGQNWSFRKWLEYWRG